MWNLVIEDTESIFTSCDLSNDGLYSECWECRVVAPDGREWEVDVNKNLAVDIVNGDSDFDLKEWAG